MVDLSANISLSSFASHFITPSIQISERPSNDILRNLTPPKEKRIAGAHELYYWQLSYGSGIWLLMSDAAVYLCIRDDVEKIAYCRPVGSLDGCLKIIEATTTKLLASSNYQLWVRYCSPSLANVLIEKGWRIRSSGWSDASPLDDELFPQVLLDTQKIRKCKGTSYRNIRLARKHQQDRWSMVVSSSPRKDAFGFARNNPPRSVVSMSEYTSFVNATELFIDKYGLFGLRFYHLVNPHGVLGAFGITTALNYLDNCVDGLFFSVLREDWLSPYFVISIADDLASNNVDWINLGGSENKRLHRFKTLDFGICQEVRTIALSYH